MLLAVAISHDRKVNSHSSRTRPLSDPGHSSGGSAMAAKWSSRPPGYRNYEQLRVSGERHRGSSSHEVFTRPLPALTVFVRLIRCDGGEERRDKHMTHALETTRREGEVVPRWVPFAPFMVITATNTAFIFGLVAMLSWQECPYGCSCHRRTRRRRSLHGSGNAAFGKRGRVNRCGLSGPE